MPLTVHDITNAKFWARPDAHDIIDEIRDAGSVQRHEAPGEGPLWATFTHEAAAAVLGDAATFSSHGGSLLGTGPGAPAGAGRMMALSDPPQHRAYREPVARFFSAKYAAELEGRIHTLTEQVVDLALARDEIDFVRDIGAVTPLTIMCELMGVPEHERDEVVRMCDQAFLADLPQQRRVAHQQLLSYLFNLAVQRRTDPRDDIVSAFAAGLDLEEVAMNCDNIIVGGIQTVRHTSAMAMLSLIQHPDAWQDLRSGADARLATEELLRWTSVGLHVLRTASTDVTLDGQHIRAGDRVVVWVPAANRDPAVFARPHHLDLARHPNRHIAFGWGSHYCIGAHLARVELQTLFTVLAERLAHVELVAEPVANRSIINFGLDSLPVRLHAAVRVVSAPQSSPTTWSTNPLSATRTSTPPRTSSPDGPGPAPRTGPTTAGTRTSSRA